MTAAWLAIYVPIVSLLLVALWRVFSLGKTAGQNKESLRQMRQDFQDMHNTLSALNNTNDRRYRQLYAEHIKFRIKVAARLGINGDD